MKTYKFYQLSDTAQNKAVDDYLYSTGNDDLSRDQAFEILDNEDSDFDVKGDLTEVEV